MINLDNTSNPALSESNFENMSFTDSNTMTIDGTVNKIGLSLVLVVGGACVTWASYDMKWVLLGGIGGFILALVTTFKKEWSPITVPMYAILEGLFLGAFSGMLNQTYPGIATQAVGLTFATLFGLLFAYRSGMIKVTDKFKTMVVSATLGLMGFYFISFILSLFGFNPFSSMFGSGIIGIGFSLFCVGLASLNLVLDFDFIKTVAQKGAPKYMEWYGAFGLLVTLIWLYIEIIRLLSKLRSND
ncbi:hypothetical protein DID75_03520 [Candidatus Marinamargulisbacteria bacterium SCGC AG-410-N11]|nr:hypothetical protein DID75_03520 [Candidatus Marinamargulisbacteria bacterium SCGC AG-410-N11]